MTPIDNNGWHDASKSHPSTHPYMEWRRSHKVLLFVKELAEREKCSHNGIRTGYYEETPELGGVWKIEGCTGFDPQYWKPIKLPKGYPTNG